jgi:hypothetical protein
MAAFLPRQSGDLPKAEPNFGLPDTARLLNVPAMILGWATTTTP